MSTNVFGDRFDGELKPVVAPTGSRGPAPFTRPAGAPSRCDRIIALIDASLAQAERVGIGGTTPLDLEVDDVLDARGGPPVFAGHDEAGRCYLAAQTEVTSTTTTWLCAPTSRLALRCVLTGRADPRDALLHSQTGYVIVATVDHTGTETTSIQLCADLSDDLLPRPAGSSVSVA